MKATATLTSKGQITIPKSVRQLFGLQTGDALEFQVQKGKVELRPARPKRPSAGVLRGSSADALAGADPGGDGHGDREASGEQAPHPMIAADTNLIIRHLTQDDRRQADKVRVLFDEAELRQELILLNHIVLCEVCWVLKAVYGFGKPQISKALHALLDDAGFHFQDRLLVEESLALYKRHSGQFSDHLIGAVDKHQGASTTYTFDKGVGKSPNFTLLK